MTRTSSPLAAPLAACSVLAILALGWAATPALADDLSQLTLPTSEVEVGGGYVSDDSAKFGEYNGLDEKGFFGVLGFDLSFGHKSGSDNRWRVTGTNLGLDTRRLQIDGGTPGRFRLTAGYDEIKRNYSDDYQTLWRGSGSTALTLPAAWPSAASRLSSTTTPEGALSNWNNIQSPYATAACAATGGIPTGACLGPAYLIRANMLGFDVGTKRTTYSAGFTLAMGSSWELKTSGQHQTKDGTKLTGVNMNRFTGPSALLPEPIDSAIDQYEAAVRWAAGKSHFSLGYYGSFYKNDVNRWTVEYAGAAATTPIPGNAATMSGMPDNQMHQFNLAAGHDFSNTTRLVVNGAWSRMTQDESFVAASPGSTWVVPERSARAKVVNTSLQARFTSRLGERLGLKVNYKYDDRDNKTPIEEFLVNPDISGASTLFENEPINRRLQQVNVDFDQPLGDGGQAVSGGYEWQEIRRTAAGEESPFAAAKTRENTLHAEYRKTLGDTVTGRISYAYSQRRSSEYEDGDPRPTSPPAPLPAADPLLPGFRQFFIADRDRDKLRGLLEFQPTPSFSLQATIDYNRDKFPDSRWGLQKSTGWVFGLDGAFAQSDKLTFDAYYTYENTESRLESLAIARGLSTTPLEPHAPCAPFPITAGRLPEDYYTDPCRVWSETQADHVHTLGIASKSLGLMDGKLGLEAGATYSRAVTPIHMTGGSYYSNGLPTLNNVVVPARSFPDATSELFDIRLTAAFKVQKMSEVRVGYLFRHLDSSDWQYDAYTNSPLGVLALQGYIGNGLTSPNYSVHVLMVSYAFRFQ